MILEKRRQNNKFWKLWRNTQREGEMMFSSSITRELN